MNYGQVKAHVEKLMVQPEGAENPRRHPAQRVGPARRGCRADGDGHRDPEQVPERRVAPHQASPHEFRVTDSAVISAPGKAARRLAPGHELLEPQERRRHRLLRLGEGQPEQGARDDNPKTSRVSGTRSAYTTTRTEVSMDHITERVAPLFVAELDEQRKQEITDRINKLLEQKARHQKNAGAPIAQTSCCPSTTG